MKAEARHSEIHGTGLFAIEEIEKDEPFLEYVGNHLNDEQLWDQFYSTYGDKYKPGDLHVWAFEVREGLYIDGDVPENIAKFETIPVKKTAKLFLTVTSWITAKRHFSRRGTYLRLPLPTSRLPYHPPLRKE